MKKKNPLDKSSYFNLINLLCLWDSVKPIFNAINSTLQKLNLTIFIAVGYLNLTFTPLGIH